MTNTPVAMESALHTYYMHNGRPVDRRYFLPGTAEGVLTVYEVLRVIGGVPLFLEDHFSRLERSARLVGRALGWTLPELRAALRGLMEANRVAAGNVRLQAQWDDGGGERADVLAFFIPHHYPPAEAYRDGVTVALLEAERDNPNAKVANLRVRELADKLIREQGCYEALLVDHEGFVTEGSRSNFFVIRGEEVVTPPVATVLPGVTRGKVLDIGARLGRPVRQRPIHRRELRELDAAFLTGTSPGVLPVARIDDIRLDAGHPLLRQFHEQYEALVQAYVRT